MIRLGFLDRDRETTRLRRAFDAPEGALVVLHGRRRLGKSRLLAETLADRIGVYYVADERDAAVQRAALATEIARVLPAFGDVVYPDWDALLDRWWTSAPPGAVLALDEFQALASTSPELPSVLQKRVDRGGRHVVLCGSSQRRMLGLVLDASAPLYGRAAEILDVRPLPVAWLGDAFGADPAGTVLRWSMWGGVPRYWELALPFADPWDAVRDNVLDPLGVLHREPDRLLLDDALEIARAASLLALVGAGCHRLSEIAARLGQPATHLSRPLARLVDLGLLRREVPFGRTTRDTKRTLYRVGEPFLAWWYRWVEPNRSRLAVGPVEPVLGDLRAGWSHHLAAVWEDLARTSVPWLEPGFGPASRWWGPADGGPVEIDVVAERGDDVLVGEVKLSCRPGDVDRLLADVLARARRVPDLRGRGLHARLFVLEDAPAGAVGAADVVRALR